MNALCKPGNDLDHVLATVEDEKQAPVAQKIDDAVGRIGMVHDKPQRRSDRAGDKRRVFQRAEIEKTHLAVERRPHVMGQRDSDGRLADPAGTSERDEALAQQSARQFLAERPPVRPSAPGDEATKPAPVSQARLWPVPVPARCACTGATKQ